MKWHKLDFVEINKEGETYKCVYVVLAKSLFKKKYIKVEFTSTIPHYFWTDIQKVMVKNGIYIEDLVEGKSTDLGIGCITYTPFTKTEFDKYGVDLDRWKLLLKKAVVKQRELRDEYDEKYGSPDLPDFLKWK